MPMFPPSFYYQNANIRSLGRSYLQALRREQREAGGEGGANLEALWF